MIANILDRLYSLFCLAILLAPVFYLVEKHGMNGFLNLIIETAGIIA